MTSAPQPGALVSIARILVRDQATIFLAVGLLSLVLINILIQVRAASVSVRAPVASEVPAAAPKAAEALRAGASPEPAKPAPTEAPSASSTDRAAGSVSAAATAPSATTVPAGPTAPSAQPVASEPSRIADRENVAARVGPVSDSPPRSDNPAPSAEAAAPASPVPGAAPTPVAAAAPEPDPRYRRIAIGTFLRAAPSVAAVKVVRVGHGEHITIIDTITNADSVRWYEVQTEYGKGFLPALAVEEPGHEPERGKVLAGVVGGVIDSATIEVGGRAVRLWGVTPAVGPWVDQFRERMKRSSPTVTCLAKEDERFRCITEDLVDLAELVILNGAARTDSAAPEVYLERELDAQKANRGVWRR